MKQLHARLLLVLLGIFLFSGIAQAQEDEANDGRSKVGFDADGVPEVAEGFEASILAKEPSFYHISTLAIGKQGRLYVGGGPQYRDPDPDDPKDSVWVIEDRDQDGKAEKVKKFATGFNSIQGLAWHDGELWVANAPDLTYVRDTNGDLKADEYVKVFSHLGHLRHGLHGLVWAPDGRLYMSQGNSKVQEGAPEAFRKLHGVETDDPVEQPLNKVYSAEEYKADYIGEWPSAEGGYLRMGPDGQNLEIFARGMRNPWDWTFGPGFDWLAVDQDPGNYGDRVLMPFKGAYFGMYHPMAGFNWMGDDPRVAPASYHFTRYTVNSLVGTVYYMHDHFPEEYRDIFFIADWANNNIYTFRQKWEGANMKDTGGMEQNFADGGENEGGELSYTPKPDKPLFRPTDMVVGPGGALYIGGWGDQYGSDFATYGSPGATERDVKTHFGRVFRIRHSERPMTPRDEWLTAKRKQPYGEWSVDQLIADLGKQVRTWRTDAQLELVRRGKKVRKPLLNAIQSGELSQMAETYAIWALGRIGPDVDLFKRLAAGKGMANRNLRIQAIRILGDNGVHEAADVVADQLDDAEPRVRMAAALNIGDIGNSNHLAALTRAMKGEQDSTVFYAQWKALRALGSRDELVELIKTSDSVNVQGGVLFALNETPDALCGHLSLSDDGGLKKVRDLLLQKAKQHCTVSLKPSRKRFDGKLEVEIHGPGGDASGLHIRYARNGELNAESPVYEGELDLEQDTKLKAAVFLDGKRVGPVVSGVYDAISDDTFSKLILTNLKVSKDKEYRIRSGALKAGEKLFIDRDYTYEAVPAAVKGATYIQTANEDAGVDEREYLQFSINKPATVYVALDSRANRPPKWMTETGFERTDLSLDTTDVTFHLYRKTYDAGNVVLGGNEGRGASNYQVVILPK
jgi:glucose/arabinose dehydrogenase